MFKKAKPIWILNKECEMNVHAVFHTEIAEHRDVELHITGSAFYRVLVNGIFVGFGPARTAKGYAREDILKLDEYLKAEKNEIIIEAVGYYCRSLSTVLAPSYVMAEVQCGEYVIAYSGQDFDGFLPACKVQTVERYSLQRHFCEVWDNRNGLSMIDEAYKAEVAVISQKPVILERKAPYPLYEDINLSQVLKFGSFIYDEDIPHNDTWYSGGINLEEWGVFPWEEIAMHPYGWIQCLRQTIAEREVEFPITLKAGEFAILDFCRIEAGFLKASMSVLEESDVVIGFSEYYEGETFTVSNMKAHNVLEYFLPQGESKELMSFEPYTFRYVMVAVKDGAIKLNAFGVKTFMFDITGLEPLNCADETLNTIHRAAVRTFAHNAVDLYMDCPSRERAGWLCDSYFTAKAEYALTGDTKVEDAFLENYRLFKNPGDYPVGVLPDCYPSDIRAGGTFIPQWTMWYILEVEEYIHKRGHLEQKEEFKASIYALLEFYRQYENEDGLLECLPSWNFVEWSKANDWTRDVNYPTNFLYARVLECVADLYDDAEYERRSREVQKMAVGQSFNGQYFHDHAIRDENGALQLQEDASEACQYYAVLFAGIDIDLPEYKELKHLILKVFRPDRKGAMPEIMEVNAFIGAYLRLETLLQMKEYELLLEDVKGFFGKMEEYTGTLWEFRDFTGSMDHGFASYALVAIQEGLKGGAGITNENL
ncbi:MAG: hypothetical protein IJZ53_12035 [Tyzzerella sp.]|nr:hypothetical protein [Tyzzerella sp.]